MIQFKTPPPIPQGISGKEALEYVKRLIQDGAFASLEEAQAFMEAAMNQANNHPLDDFQGLSPSQVSALLHNPFDSPELVVFPNKLMVQPDTPASRLFMMLVEAIGEKGLKATAKGNLPRNFCREAAQAHLGEAGYANRIERGEINSEEEFFPIQMINLTAQKAGFIRKVKGVYTLTARARKIIQADEMASLYPILFRTFAKKINWGYFSFGPDAFFLQQSFPVSLYFLKIHGETIRALNFYSWMFLKAFPSVIVDFTTRSAYCDPERDFHLCYCIRVLENFAEFWGLAEITGEDCGFGKPDLLQIRTTRLFSQLVDFKI